MSNKTKMILAISGLLACSLSQAATLSGTVMQPDGVTPAQNLLVLAYKFDPSTGTYNYGTGTETDADGKFSFIPTFNPDTSPGVYLVAFRTYDDNYNGGDPWEPYSGYYENDPLAAFYNETYNDVTEATPNKAPTPIVIANPNDNKNLGVVKLNNRTLDTCMVTGPITINGTDYSSFTPYPNGGPALPLTGGQLVVLHSE